jgi:hypothetical protein
MSAFKDMVSADIHDVFLNLDEFAERRTVKYDGKTYADVPVVLNGLKEKDRSRSVADHAQGLYLVTDIMHVALSDIGGKLPERGNKIEISTREGGTFLRQYYITQSQATVGMVRLELGAIDE